MLALAARGLPGLRAMVTISGGLRCGRGDNPQRSTPRQTPDWFARMLATFGATHHRAVALDLCGQRQLLQRADGARDARRSIPAPVHRRISRWCGDIGEDGHDLFTAFEGRERWLATLDLFLQRHGLPTWSKRSARTGRCGRAAFRPAYRLQGPALSMVGDAAGAGRSIVATGQAFPARGGRRA